MKVTLLLLIFIGMISCSNDVKFDKSKWLHIEDLTTFPYRQSMLKDLTNNHKLKGLTYNQLIDLIGKPQENIFVDSNEIYYPILTEYKFGGVDVNNTITLAILLNKDSTVKDYQILEKEK